jgi:hypothetical protein
MPVATVLSREQRGVDAPQVRVEVDIGLRMSTLALLITRDRNLTNRLTKSLSDFAGDALTIESANVDFGLNSPAPVAAQ